MSVDNYVMEVGLKSISLSLGQSKYERRIPPKRMEIGVKI